MKNRTMFFLLLLVLLPLALYGQRSGKKITITGNVTGINGNPVRDAVIFIDKVKTDVVTDDQGNYRIRVKPDAREILVFTLPGGAAEEQINGRTRIDFVLKNASGQQADKPAVSGIRPGNRQGEPSGKKESNPDRIEYDQQSSTNATFQSIYDMIRGRFPGVEVSGKSIKVMGSSSLNVSSEPLFVVDGVIVNTIEDISPQNVRSIEVLKGPDATVYGARGSNGVIIITRITGKDK